jgi:hypothetical protein
MILMEYTYSKSLIKLPDKELTILDRLVFKFLGAVDFKYVIISGYIAILFGRSRNTEDVDMFIDRISKNEFSNFCDKLYKLNFYILNSEDADDAYDMLKEGSSVRFAEKNTTEPNFELKFPKRETDYYSMENSVKVIVSERHEVMTAPLELQIAYKLYLGSEKDYLDARHLYKLFQKDINKKEFNTFLNKLDVKKRTLDEVLGEFVD